MKEYERISDNSIGLMDELTGIYNRYGFYKYTRELLDKNPDFDFCIMYWNIRKFKVVNELFGMEVGDEVLISLANSLKGVFGERNATFGRMDSDNFVCCVQYDLIELGKWKDIGDTTYLVGESEYHFFSCCGLYKIIDPTRSISRMSDKARVAMETIKGNYISLYSWYTDDMWDTILEEQALNSDFKTAIDKKQFKVYYQPICRASDGLVTGAEALVRWEHPRRGLISPGAFIPLFERNGFITILDHYVWDEVCRLQRERLDSCKTVVPISMNVSRVEFYNPSLCDDIREIVKKHNIPPNLIKIEITESAYSDNPQQVLDSIRRLHDYGFLVLMDDFGSGYSSLNILKDLPIDVLKIDMQFMNGFEKNQKAAIILEAVIRMAKWMKLKVVSEGVETRKEWEYLKSIECDLVQGYYFYKPIPEKSFSELLDRIETMVLPEQYRETLEAEDVIFDAFNRTNSRESTLFYSMIGGMGILELSGDTLEIIQVNRGYYEVMFSSSDPSFYEQEVLSKPIEEPIRSLLLDRCIRSKETDTIQQAQIHFHRKNRTSIWINAKIRYLGSRGKRSLFYFSVDNIDEIKNAEAKYNLSQYTDALLHVFDKVYLLNYETGKAIVLHTSGCDSMEPMEGFTFRDFFDRFKDSITILHGQEIVDAIKKPETLSAALDKKFNKSASVVYQFAKNESDLLYISVLFFKVQSKSGQMDYLCCVKKTKQKPNV